jgi:hypothetical protein
MEKDTYVFCHRLLKTHVLLFLVTAIRTAPITDSSALNYGSLTNVTDSAKQIKHELEWNKAAKAVATEELQVLDQLIIDDADRRLSSGTNLTETSTTEDVVPGQLMFEEITQASKGLGTTSDIEDAEIIQVHFTFTLPCCIVIDFFLNDQTDALFILILLCYKTLEHPDSAWKRSSKTCMKLTSAECAVEHS